MSPSLSEILPEDGTAGTLVGRVWRAGHPAGPSVVRFLPPFVAEEADCLAVRDALAAALDECSES